MTQVIPNAPDHAWNENSRKAKLDVAELKAAYDEKVSRLRREPQTDYVRFILGLTELNLLAGVFSIWVKYAKESVVHNPRFARHFDEDLPSGVERYREICAKISGCLDPDLLTRLPQIAQYYQKKVDMLAVIFRYPSQRLKADESERQVELGPKALKQKQRADQQKQRADRRQPILQTFLDSKGLNRCKLVAEACVSNNAVYDYWNGKTKSLSHNTRQAIADALDVKQEDLPD